MQIPSKQPPKVKAKNYLAAHIVKKTFDNGGEILNVKLKCSDLLAIENKDGWCSIVIAERREPSDKGATHYAYENTWKPTGGQNSGGDGLPF